jgi:phospholipase A2
MLQRYYLQQHPSSTQEGEDGAALDRSVSSASGSGSSEGGKKHSFGSVMKDIAHGAKASLTTAKTFAVLEHRLGKDLSDPGVFPEVQYQAAVRRGLDLCADEQAYLRARKTAARDHFARYMGWDPAHVHPDDVPTVAFGGSGGGYRAMLAFLGYSRAMKLTGMWPLLSYIAGVSGSCKSAWRLALSLA